MGKRHNWSKEHIFFCKQYLGVNKRSPNAASRNELGRLPLKLLINLYILKFWIHLQNVPENSTAKQCLYISKEMAEKNANKFNSKD